MKPAETGKIADTGIIAVKNARNSIFFVSSSDGYIMIDAGSDADSVKKSMEETGIGITDVSHILITHSDYDHVAALSLFPEASLYMSEDEMQMINGETKRNLTGGNSLPGIDIESVNLLTDGQELVIGGNTIECVKTPGHTAVYMSYVLIGEYLFSGDSFRVTSENSVKVHPFSMDGDLSEASIKNLGEIAERTELTLTSHYGYYESGSLKFEQR
jgi:glyoxylase-like metal-dependent hydrolase (beta-lactamase superfamily II)